MLTQAQRRVVALTLTSALSLTIAHSSTSERMPLIGSQAQLARASTLEVLSQVFSVVDKPHEIFEVTKEFALRPVCVSNELAEIRVVPRHYFDSIHPEWVQPKARPFFDGPSFAAVMKKIEDVRPLGAIVAEPADGFSSNSTLWLESLYARGVVSRGMRRAAPPEVLSFRVVYFRTLSGKVEDIYASGIDKDLFVAIVDSLHYWIAERTFRSTRISNVAASIEVAGPAEHDPSDAKPTCGLAGS